MFELRVEREFCAAHALMIHGERETLHGHNFRVSIVVAGSTLDSDGLLVDFHRLERVIDGVLAPMTNQNLNDLETFRSVNPSAEHIARHIAEGVQRGLKEITGHGAATPQLEACSVTEAPGCTATYRPGAISSTPGPKERGGIAR